MKEERFDLQMLLTLAWRHWYIFAIILPLSLAVAYLYLQKEAPVYQSSASFLINDEEESGQLSEAKLFEELGFGKNIKNLENERSILSSTPVMFEVVRSLNLQYQYSAIRPLRNRELYQNSPIEVLAWDPGKEGAHFYGEVEIDGKGGYQLTYEERESEEEKLVRGVFGKKLFLPQGRLTLIYKNAEQIEGPFGVRITSAWVRAKELKESLEVGMEGEESSILRVYFKDLSAVRARDVIQTLLDKYNQRTINRENQVFLNATNLINERIELINEDLTEAEEDVEQYKRNSGMAELSAEGTLLLNKISEYNNQVKETEVQLAILESLEEYLISNQEDFKFIPTNMSLSNPTLISHLNSFNTLLAEKDLKENNLGPDHPDLILVEKQVINLRQTIIDNIESMRGDLLIVRNSKRDLQNDLEQRMRSLPSRERGLVEIARRKNVKENLYLYLLQKREESAISMSIIRAKGEIIEPPEIPDLPISPKPAQIWLIGGFLGLAIPSGIVLLLTQWTNRKVQNEEDIEWYSSLPLGGSLAHDPKSENLFIKENSRSKAAEMFRMLRFNLAYIVPGQRLKSLLITSTTSGEGKSFIALNLGMAMAVSGSKVLILEIDLRRPKQEETFLKIRNGQTPSVGIVNFLNDYSLEVDDIIRNSQKHPELDYIVCGPKPSNPGELILSERLDYLMSELKERYDLILVDSPPVGIVADAFRMKNLVDATLFVVRAGYTYKKQLQIINNIAKMDKLPNPFIVLNDVRLKGYGYYNNSKYHVRSNGYFEKEV